MATEHTATEIKSRFEIEQHYISQYVEFLQIRSTIEDPRIFELNKTIRDQKLSKLETRPYDRLKEPFSPDEIAALVANIEKLTPDVRKALRTYEKRGARQIPLVTPKGMSLSHRGLLGEWVNYLMEQFSAEPGQEEIEKVRKHSLHGALEEVDRDESVTDEELVDIIDDAISVVMDIKREAREGSLQYILHQFQEIRLIARFTAPDSEVNILRQGFILLMTAFDAAIFDLMRVKLRKDFFILIGAFGKQEKVSLHEIGEAGTFEVFRDRIIEGQLKTRYIKDLLFILSGLGIKCIDESIGDRFIQMIELVLRRNVHVHNRGVIDERYLERDQNNSPKYNLYNLKLGDVAKIEQSYWELANRLTSYCVTQVAHWANT